MTTQTSSEILHKYCVVIPVFRHVRPLIRTLLDIQNWNLPCIIVDDGNDPPIKDAITAAIGSSPWIEIIRLEKNGGKGAATKFGLQHAHQKGYTHMLTIDADGQHNTADLKKLIDLSKQDPGAVILGRPVFDHSVPPARLWGRKISQVWVWIETLSRDIQDPLCGLRCYPIKPAYNLTGRVRLGNRMTFDPEILVRLHWTGCPMKNFDTKVVYPEGGISNYKQIKDNVAISWLHTRLFFNMIIRFPVLLYRRRGKVKK